MCIYIAIIIIIIIIIIVITHVPSLASSLACSPNSTCPTNQALLIQCSAKTFLTVRQVLSITAFCLRMYRVGRSLSSYNVCGIIPLWVALAVYVGRFQLP